MSTITTQTSSLPTTNTTTMPKTTTTSKPPSEQEIPRGPTTSTLIFYAPPLDNAPPFNYVETPPPGLPQKNYTEHACKVHINDIRTANDTSIFQLDTHGFAIASAVTSDPQTTTTTDFTSSDSIEKTYYPQVETLLLQNVHGAKRVFLFDHTIRKADGSAKREPVRRAHVDQTEKAAIQRVHRHLPHEASTLLQQRVRIINVWRPLNGPVVSFPLAMADSRTVSEDAVVGVEHRYPDRVGETAGVKFDEKQEWWYWSGMKNDESLFLQCYDSELGRRTPHTAFADSRTKDHWPGRESIEVRALVFG
jgi:hypothetical protein